MPPALLYAIGVIVFALGLLLSIALHEIGHMVPAKKFGVKVTQYMVGFGPTLWSKKKGDTEYGIKAIPLGGYIRMIGMVPPRADGRRSRWPRRLATSIEDFRQVSRSEVDPQDAHREFYRLTPGKKMIVMLGGPCMNLLIFLVLTVILLTTIGTQQQQTTTTVGAVEKCVVPANSKAAQGSTCPPGAPRTPAYGVLRPHDTFVSINGTPITSWNQLTSLIQPAAGQRLTIVVRREGRLVTLHATPIRNSNYVSGSDTKIATVGFLGFEPHNRLFLQTVPITGVPGQIGGQLHLAVDALGNYPAKLHNLWDTVFTGAKRDQDGALGVVGISRLSGDFASSTQITNEEKILTLLGLLASVNLLLFFFNLLPLLPLDGGHVAGALFEAAKRGHARLKARGQPVRLGPDGQPVPRHLIFVDTAQMLPVMYAVASVLVLVTLLTLYADIVNPINPFG